MLEKEVKILEINQEQIIKKLLELGAEKTFEGYIHDVYYDFVDGKDGKMEANKRLFRVRKKGELHLYTIKRKRTKLNEGGEKGLKVADEGENEITNVESFGNVLEKYGMKKIREKKKFRVSYKLGDIEFDIDNYDEIPPLIEIEAPTKNEIENYIKLLGLEKHKIVKFGSRGLFEYYKKPYFNY